ncbi:hypothetical protein BH09BAC5_BH09BAC5_04490 [soil metagenome]
MKTFLYKSLDISPHSNKLLLFWIPPFFMIYTFAVGNYLLEKRNKKNRAFQIATIIAFAFFCSPIFILSFFKHDFLKNYSALEISISLICLASFYISIGLLSWITVRYERSLKAEKYYSFAENLDYVKRFLCFAYYPFTIWSFQHIVNEYCNRKTELNFQ